MSSELVMIKASALRWCPHGFTFYLSNGPLPIEYSGSKTQLRALNGGGLLIQVNTKQYTDAVIDTINGMFYNNICSVSKITAKDKPDVAFGVWVFYKTGSGRTHNTRVSADPWPWKETGEWRAEK